MMGFSERRGVSPPVESQPPAGLRRAARRVSTEQRGSEERLSSSLLTPHCSESLLLRLFLLRLLLLLLRLPAEHDDGGLVGLGVNGEGERVGPGRLLDLLLRDAVEELLRAGEFVVAGHAVVHRED